MITPFEKIKKSLAEKIPSKSIRFIPDKWEKLGDVAVIKLHNKIKRYKKLIGKAYANVLNCKTVLWDKGGISGEYREPETEIIYGSTNCETIHKENNVKYKLDPRKIMFSSGNMDERRRMANISNNDEVVVDLFAGIGYFSLPIAVYSKPKRIFACEKNPTAFDYLCQNIVLNDVTNIVEPLKGDNRDITPRNIADRVILGYIGDTHNFLSTAVECLNNKTGIIHYHDTFSERLVPDEALKHVCKIAYKYDRNFELLKKKHVKSYAPGVSHFVFDIKFGEK